MRTGTIATIVGVVASAFGVVGGAGAGILWYKGTIESETAEKVTRQIEMEQFRGEINTLRDTLNQKITSLSNEIDTENKALEGSINQRLETLKSDSWTRTLELKGDISSLEAGYKQLEEEMDQHRVGHP